MDNDRNRQTPKTVRYPPDSMVLHAVFDADPPVLPYFESETELLEVDRPELLEVRYCRQN